MAEAEYTVLGMPWNIVKWQARYYGSGTTNVTCCVPGEPWLYVYGPKDEDEDRQQSNRYPMCEQLAAWLNGGERPKWLDDMERQTETLAVGLDGSSIEAVGPMIDAAPPNLHWVTDDSDDAKNKRARLLDQVFRPDPRNIRFGPPLKL